MAKKVLLWILQVILLLAFLFFGITKFLTSPADAAGVFGKIGGAPMQYFTGAYEVISALLVLFPVTAFLGAIMLAIAMAVAIVLHLTVIGFAGELLPVFILAIVFLIMSVYLAIKRRPDFLKRN